MINQEIAKILREMAAFYEMENAPFKPRAYERAAEAVAALDQEVAEIYKQKGVEGFLEIDGIGQGIALHLEELVQTGKLKIYEKFRHKIPVNLSELLSVEGIGPKSVKILYQNLKIKNQKDLEKAAKAHKIAALPGFGEKSESKILEGLKFREGAGKRHLLGEVAPIVEKFCARLEESKLFERVMVGGSYRRRQETVGDIDILALSRKPRQAMEFFVKLEAGARVLEHGKTKSEIKLASGLQVDLRIVPPESWGAALQYFTGDLSHNVKLRKIAIEKGLKLSEYGLTPSQSPPYKGGEKKRGHPPSRGGKGRGVKIETEEQVYHALDMDWIPPELRTDSGEIEAAQAHKLPKLLAYGSVRGDLQIASNWTDGQNSIEELAKAAQALGREYICVTDHTKTLYMTGGLDEKKLLRQMKEIDKLNQKSKIKNQKFQILKGAEVNILKDGSLDIADEVLAQLDVVGVAVHSNFKMSSAEMTKRLVRVLSNPHVDILFHPTTRIINRRPPIEFDFDKILEVAKKNRVALEIDAHPTRLDLHDTLIRKAVKAGVKLVIDTDAHNIHELDFLKYGEAQARRGWASKNDVLNTRPVEELLKYFSKKL